MPGRSSFRLTSFIDPWFPTECARCGALGRSPCSQCCDQLVAATTLEPPDGVDGLFAIVHYDEISRPFIADLKYRGMWATARAFGPAIAGVIVELFGNERNGVVVTWAPTTPRRVRDRGFDQAELLASEAGRHLAHPVRRLLRRRPGAHQTGRSRHERSEGVVFEARGRCADAVVVIDDVVTTGATFTAAASALREAGANTVVALALAATPPP